MHTPYLQRASELRRGSARVVRWLLAGLSALVMASGVLLLGVAMHKLVLRDVIIREVVPQEAINWNLRRDLVPAAEVRQPADPLLGGLLELAVVQQATLAGLCGALAVAGALLWLLWQMMTRNGQYEAQEAISHLRREIYRKAVGFGSRDALGQSAAERLFLKRTDPLRHGLTVLWQQAPRSEAGAVVLLITAMVIDPWITLLGALLAVGAGWQMQASRRRAEERSHELHGQAAKSESLLRESLQVAPLTASYGLQQGPGESFETNLKVHASAQKRGYLVRALLGARAVALGLAGVLITFTVFCLSGRLPLASGVVIAAALLGACLLGLRLLAVRQRLEEADSAAQEIYAYLDRDVQLPEAATPRELGDLTRALTLDQVTWEDSRGRKVLDGASCRIPAGKLTAVLSSDELAPAVLANLAARLQDPAGGRVLYDGHDLKTAYLQQVRKRLVLVPARDLLFTGTVLENICCGEEFSAEDVTSEAQRVKALEPIRRLPQGLSTLVGPLGVDLDVDTSFLIMLTRATLRKPSVLIVEEPEGAGPMVLDAVQAAAAAGHSVLMIPAQVDSLRRADHVILLHQGKVQQAGTHAELLKASDLYRHLNYMRFNPYRGNGSR